MIIILSHYFSVFVQRLAA